MKVALKNSRAMLQRTRDAKIARVWVTGCDGSGFQITAPATLNLEIGDEFVANIFGHPWQLTAKMRLTSLEAAGSNVRARLEPHGPIATKESPEEPRFKVQGLSLDYVPPGERDKKSAQVVEIGAHGFSWISETEFEKGSLVLLELHTSMRQIDLTCEVRNCRRLDGAQARYRAGVKLLTMDKMNGEWWEELFDETLQSNMVDISGWQQDLAKSA